MNLEIEILLDNFISTHVSITTMIGQRAHHYTEFEFHSPSEPFHVSSYSICRNIGRTGA